MHIDRFSSDSLGRRRLATRSAALLLSLLSAAACSGGKDGGAGGGGNGEGGGSAGPVHIEGGIQKGPFVIGSNVQVSMIDATTGDPTGAVFNTTTESDLGDFKLTLPQPGAAELMTTGYYFNEITGKLSDSQITMRALGAFNAESQSVYVNAVTQMSYRRAKKLIAGGTPFADAISQAETELRSAFGLPQRSALGGGTAMNLLGGDTDANAYLLAVSCVLAQAAENENGASSVDAKLSEIMSNIALDLEPDGALGEPITTYLGHARKDMDGQRCMANTQKRLTETGASATVPNVFKALDFDGDGKVDADDEDADEDGVLAADDKVLFVLGGSAAVDAGGQLWGWAADEKMPRVWASFEKGSIKGAAYSSKGPAVVKNDGTVWIVSGEKAAPTQVSGLDQVASFTCGTNACMAVKSDGTVWAFDPASPTTPASQMPSAKGWTDAATVVTNNVAAVMLKKDGTVWYTCPDGTVGEGPIKIDGITQATAVGLGSGEPGDAFRAGTVLTADGKAWAWKGGAMCLSFTVTEAADNVAFISALGGYAVKKDGTLWELGETQDNYAQVPGILNAAAVSSGAVVVTTDGSVFAREPHPPAAYRRMAIPR